MINSIDMMEDLSLAERVRENIAFVKSLTDLECMVWAREGDRLYDSLDEVDFIGIHSKMGDPVYDKLDLLFDPPGGKGFESNVQTVNDNTYADLMDLIQYRKMSEKLYNYILNNSLDVVRDAFSITRLR
jgi:hypothetical protein